MSGCSDEPPAPTQRRLPPSYLMTVLASAPVVTAVSHDFLVLLRLTIDAQAHAGDSLTAGSEDDGGAFCAVQQALAPWQPVPRAIDGILDGRIDLVLYCAISCEAAGHAQF